MTLDCEDHLRRQERSEEDGRDQAGRGRFATAPPRRFPTLSYAQGFVEYSSKPTNDAMAEPIMRLPDLGKCATFAANR